MFEVSHSHASLLLCLLTTLGPSLQGALDDEQELRQARAEEANRLREQRLKEAFNELKHSDKAKDMKEQVGASAHATHIWDGQVTGLSWKQITVVMG